MITVSTRRTLVALAAAAALLPAGPALAQTSPLPTTPTPTTTVAPTSLAITSTTRVIEFGQTVDITVTGTAGASIDLQLSSARSPEQRVIRTATLGANGSSTFTGLQPGESSAFSARLAGASGPSSGPSVTVLVRRAVTIGISQANGVYTFAGQLARAEAGVQVTIARLDSETKRVTGVASTRTDAAGRYTIRTGLPQGFAGYYALTETRSFLEAGRSRLYGLIVNTRPGTTTPPPSTSQGLSLNVRRTGASYSFEGVLSPARGGVAVTLAQVVDGQLQGMAGGVTEANGRYIINIQPPPGTYVFTALTANVRSRDYGLVVPAAPAPQPVVTDPGAAGGGAAVRPADRSCDDFGGSQAAAQAFFERYRAQFGDFADLDGNDDGIACNALL